MRRILALGTVATSLALVAPAHAQLLTTASPDKAGKPTTLSFRLDANGPPINGQLATSLAIGFSGGFGFNLRAVTKRCTNAELTIQPPECPPQSEIGSGRLNVTVTSGKVSRPATLPFALYMPARTNTKVKLIIEIAGFPHVLTSTLDTAGGGLSMAFTHLPGVKSPFYSVALNSIAFKLGASNVVTTKRKRIVTVKVKGKLRRVTRIVTIRARYSLITNPSQCNSSWASSITLGLSGGPATFPARIACSA